MQPRFSNCSAAFAADSATARGAENAAPAGEGQSNAREGRGGGTDEPASNNNLLISVTATHRLSARVTAILPRRDRRSRAREARAKNVESVGSPRLGTRTCGMLLVEAGWRILRSKGDDTAALRAWALLIAARRGKRIAVVALARSLAGITYAMWRDGRPYDAANFACIARSWRRQIGPRLTV